MLSLMLDSGAFSAWSLKKEIDLQEYISFINNNSKCITTTVNLDVINPKSPNDAAKAGMENFRRMLDSGVKAMPVYHAREDFSYLEQMLELTDYIGLSTTSLVSPVEGKHWSNLVWNFITDSKGLPIVRTHAFGDTAPLSLLTYPWYSADSATWMIQGGRAACVKLNEKVYQLRSHLIRHPHYISLDDPLPKKEAWEEEMRALGLDPTSVMTVATRPTEMAMIRCYLVASNLLRLAKRAESVTKFSKSPSLIPFQKQADGGIERDGGIKLYFVISPSAYYFNFVLLDALKIKNVLVSYFYVKTAPKNFWEEMLLPFIINPHAYVMENPKTRKYAEKLQEVLVKKNLVEV